MIDYTRLAYLFLRCVISAICLLTTSMAFAQVPVGDTTNHTDESVVIRHIPPAVIGRYPYGVTFLKPEQTDSVIDYAATDLVPIIFKCDKTDLILPNVRLDSIVGVVNRILNDRDAGFSYVWIGGSASPEGPEAHNVWLGKARAKRLYDYLKTHTTLPDSLIRIDNLMEDWRTPLRLIRQQNFPHKERVLEIWANQPDRRKRKREIMSIDNGVTWKYLIDKAFRPARNARMVIVCTVEDSTVVIPPLPPIAGISEYPPDRPRPIPVITVAPAYRGQFVAVKTNLAALGLLVANLGMEFSFGHGFSLDLPFYYSPYDINSKFRVRILGTQPELRYWLRRDCPGDGHFFGLNGTVAGFNVSFPGTDRFQDPERALWGAGLSYGYALSFGADKHWGLEFNLGAGYMNYHFDTFDNVHNGKLMHTGKKDYWGITRIGLSLTYKFRYGKQLMSQLQQRRPEHD